MIKTIYDYFMLSMLGFVKVFLFLLLFCFSIFFFVKSKDLAMEEKPAFAGLLTDPGTIQYWHAAYSDDDQQKEADEPNIEDMTPEEAEVFLFVLRFSDNITSASARNLAKLIVEECDKNNKLDPYLILAVIKVESEFSPVAVSEKGAIGLMQIMPRTGEFVANNAGISYSGRKSLYNPLINVRLGIRYLSQLTDRYDATEHALGAYNYGPSNFERILGPDSKPTGYAKKVLKFKSYLEEESILLAKNG